MGLRGNKAYECLVPVALAFFVGILVARGSEVLTAKVTTSFGYLAVAWLVGFLLAHVITRGMTGDKDGFASARFPPPLQGPVPPETAFPRAEQGRAFLPHRPFPTAPPGPQVPADDDPQGPIWETAAPEMTAAPTPLPRPANSGMPTRIPLTRRPMAPMYRMAEGDMAEDEDEDEEYEEE